MTDRVGQYFGNYELVKLLGQGGYAKVYLGKHRYLNSFAALKVLNVTIQSGTEHKFLAEAQRLVDLRHPNIVHLLDFGIENGAAGLIMDYVPKGSLRQQYPDGTQVPLSTVVDIVLQIAAALQYAHNHNVIHRDVKPENILLDADDHLFLSDFGLSLFTPPSQELSTQDPAGTPRYMAPEQLHGKPCFASDQYALAVMVYEWLCGKHPFYGTMWEIWQQHLYTAPPPLRTIRPELPPMLETVVLRALAKKPQDRFVSIQAFALALARASQTSIPADERDVQATTRLQSMTHSSSIVHRAAALPSLITQIPTKALTLVTTPQASAVALQDQNRERMLRRLRRSYSEVMGQSLQGAAWLDLGIAAKPDAVQNVAHLLLRAKSSAEQHLPPGTSIAQTYDAAEHELLILGEPGAGKSTLLLNLAQQLVMRAEQEKMHPLPVILPLSSWAIKRLPLQDWMAEQLTQIYDVPHQLSVRWVQEDGILPLLDGLDEMEETARAACIAAINTYHRDHMAPLVVCSRTTEYETAASPSRLILQGAVVVQPLTHEDVDAYLIKAGERFAPLRNALRKNAALNDLATTPLVLNILILTYQGTSMHDLSNRQSLLIEQVWNDFVERMVARKGDSKRYPLGRTRAWLSWMARQMREHNQTVFYLEHLQPDWLAPSEQLAYAWQAVRWPAIVIGILISFFVSLFFFGDLKLAGLATYIEFGNVGWFLAILAQRPREIREEHRHLWLKRLITRLAISASFGAISGFGIGLYLSAYPNVPPDLRQTYALSFSVVQILGALLLQYILAAQSHFHLSTGSSTSGAWTRFVRFFQSVQGPCASLVALTLGLTDALVFGPIFGPAAWVSVGLSNGLIYALISLALSTQMEYIRPVEHLNWTWRSLSRSLFKTRHLRITILLTCVSMICVGLNQGLSRGIGDGLSIGLSYWCSLGLFQGIAQERIDNQDRRVANQGIHRSLRNSLIMGIIGGAVVSCVGLLTYGLTLWSILGLNRIQSYGLSSVLRYGVQSDLISDPSAILNYVLLLYICGALLTFLLTGGLAVLRHYTIRLLLWRSHTFPLLAPQFLDDATARFLLRRVGGGYSFTHRLLLDHLADATERGAQD